MSTSGPNELATDVDKPLGYSNRNLSQSEGAGADFYTLNFVRLSCADVLISPEGQRIYNNCLSNVPRWTALDQRLQFGIGDRHLFTNVGVQLYEYEHFVLASALGEFFTEAYAAAVFNELAEFYEEDDKPKPHLASFRGFVHCANGLLAPTRFPLLVDDRIRLNPYRDHDRGVPHSDRTTEFVPINKVALAIKMLGQFKSGKVKHLTLVGGDVIGWFSAYVEDFLGMNQIVMDKDGNKLYWTKRDAICVNLIYMPPESSQDTNDSTTIWLRKPINTSKRGNTIPPKMTGRVVGEAMFSKVFGTAFHILDQRETKAFGNALGGIARSWELWTDQTNFPMSDDQRFDPGSSGFGLVQTWTNWFPELRHLQGRMERALKKDKQAAGDLCQESIERLEPLCGCYICGKTEGTEDNPTNQPKHDFCLPTMMETIIILGLSLSRVTLGTELFPSRAGILAMYKDMVKKRLRLKEPDLKDWDRVNILYGENWNQTTPQRLQNIITLFSGSRPTDHLPDNLMAISHEGMCAYVLKTQRGDQITPSSENNIIRVVVGNINWRTKIYSRLCVGVVQPPVHLEDGWESFVCEHFTERIYVR